MEVPWGLISEDPENWWCWAPKLLWFESVRLPWIAKIWLEKPTFRRGKWKLSSPSYGSGLEKTWLNPDVHWTKMANRQQKWIQWNWFLMKKVLALQCQEAEPSGWPWKWTFNLWWWRGLLWGCLNPLRGGKVEAGKQGNKYFPVEKSLNASGWHPTVKIIFLLLGKE